MADHCYCHSARGLRASARGHSSASQAPAARLVWQSARVPALGIRATTSRGEESTMLPSRSSLGAVAATAIAPVLLVSLLAGATHAATPETVTLTPADTAKTWQTPILGVGTGLDRSMCVEDVSCDTVRIQLLPG